ncbi:MAG: hypothetical protein A4E53_03883 [Pelotomaculum sp. PtaB.Bin104]|nr:MAG: hypothetical protein A4E53_03883 [Pelotomaculum sp. PtaB.Bin104]
MQEQDEKTFSKYDPEVIKQLKKEIIGELEDRREWQEKYYHNGNHRGNRNPQQVYHSRRQPKFEDDWWNDREEYDYQRNMSMARKQLQGELRSLVKMNQRMGQVRDPQIRQMLNDLLHEAQEQGMGVQELLDSLAMNNGSRGFMGPFWNRATSPLRDIDRRSFGWGAGAALLGLLLLPSVAKSVRPLICKAMEEAMEMNERVQGVFAQAKEELEDIVAEANFNKLTASMNGPLANEGMSGKNEMPQDNKTPQGDETLPSNS